MSEQKIEDKIDESWEEIWKPLLYTKGKPDIKKIKNEMHDLIFIYEQVGKVYYALTGGMLSKPMYYADQIISLHEQELEDSYNNGYKDGKEDANQLLITEVNCGRDIDENFEQEKLKLSTPLGKVVYHLIAKALDDKFWIWDIAVKVYDLVEAKKAEACMGAVDGFVKYLDAEISAETFEANRQFDEDSGNVQIHYSIYNIKKKLEQYKIKLKENIK
jgi:hypothetical protein